MISLAFGGFLFGVAVVSLTGFVVFAGSTPGNDWIRATINETVTLGMDEGRFEIDVLRTDLFKRAEIDGLRIVDGAGVTLLELDHARARFDIFTLITGPLKVHELDGVGLSVNLDAGQDGRMLLASVFGPASGSTEPFSLPIDLDVTAVSVEGVEVRKTSSLWVQGGVLNGRVASAGPVFDVSALTLCAQVVLPGPSNVCVEGPVLWDGADAAFTGLAIELPGTAIAVAGTVGSSGSDLDLLVGGLDLVPIDPLASNVGLSGTWGGELSLKGPIDGLALTGRLAGTEESEGSLVVDGRISIGDEVTWGGDIRAYDFHVEDAYPGTGRPVILDGEVTLDGKGLRFPDELDLGIGFRGTAWIDGQYHLERADLTARLSDGQLEIANLDFYGIAGQLKATGDISVIDGPMNLVVTGQVVPAELAELGILGLSGNGKVKLGISGDLKAAPGVFDIRGSVEMAPFGYENDVRFAVLNADFRGRVSGPDADLVVDATGVGGVAFGVEMTTLSAPEVDVKKTAAGITAVGPAHVDGVFYPGLGTFETADLTFDYRAPTRGELAVDAEVTLGAFDLQTFPGSGGQAVVAMVGDQVEFTVGLDAWSRSFLRTDGTFDLGTSRLRAPRFEIAPTPRLAWVAEAPIELTVVEGGVADAVVALRSLHGNVDLSGNLANTGALDGAVKVQAMQLDVLAELFPESFNGLSGVLDLDLAVSGTADDPTILGNTKLHGLWLDGVTRWLDVAGDLAVERGVLTTDLELGSAGAPMATLTGKIPVNLDLQDPSLDPLGQVEVEFVLLPGELVRLEHVTPDPLGLPEGDLSAIVQLSGRMGDPVFRVSGVVESGVGGWVDPGRVEFDIRRQGLDLEGWAAVREGLEGRAEVDGGGTTRIGEVVDWLVSGEEAPDTSDMGLWLDNMALSLVLRGLPADSIARAAEVGVTAGGELVGGVSVFGNPYTPTLEGGLHWLGGSVGSVELQSAYLTLVPTEGGVQLNTSLDFPKGSLGLDGVVPLTIDLREDPTTWITADMELAVVGEGVPLALLSVVDSGFTEASGLASVQGVLRGRADNPVPDLTATVVDGSFAYIPLGVRFKDLQIELESDRRRLKLNKLVATTEPITQVGLFEDSQKSRISITGAANIEAGEVAELSARLLLEDAWVVGTFGTSLRLDGDLRLSGAWPRLNVDGDIGLVQGRFLYNSDAAISAGPLQPVPELVIHRATGTRVFVAEEVRPFYSAFDVKVGLDLNRNLEVIGAIPFLGNLGGVTASLTKANVSARLGGNLDIALDEVGTPVFSGEVDVVDGGVKLLRTSFSLDEGKLVFFGGDIENTRLDLAGSTTVQGVPIDLRIGGTAEEPTLLTTSAGYDDTQVLLMLLTGQVPDSVGGEQGAAGSALIEAASLLATTVLAGSSSGLLTVDPDGAVRVGAPWSAAVFTQAIFRPQPDSDENRVALFIDWTLFPRLVFTIGAGDKNQWGDVTWEIRF